jgi:hypothetical protein
VVVERSAKARDSITGFGEEDDDLFQDKTRFESSGILNGDGSVIGTRVKQKREALIRGFDVVLDPDATGARDLGMKFSDLRRRMR